MPANTSQGQKVNENKAKLHGDHIDTARKALSLHNF